MTAPESREAFAAAKINLALHVVGRRPDGYHELDSLVVFAACGDRLVLTPDDVARLTIDGPFAADLSAGEDNLVLRAVRAVEGLAGPLPLLRFRLTKRLPVASGIGGGSADAAAALRLAAGAAALDPDDPRLASIATALGADVPMCLLSRPLRARGIGDSLTPWTGVPRLPIVLANPAVAVATPAVFRRLQRRDDGAMPAPPQAPTVQELAVWLGEATRNDLEAAAIAEAPIIAAALASLGAAEDCLLARMSGSGATVFGLFPDDAAAARAAQRLADARPGWWIIATSTGAS